MANAQICKVVEALVTIQVPEVVDDIILSRVSD
jgi:hypothetical protein